jgi:hypothetical protein
MITSLVPQLIPQNINNLDSSKYSIHNKCPPVEQRTVHLWTVFLFIKQGVR